jgi:UDP-3-O-[3-hydroxymyristoyl] glucosamine N-acyltransferase
MKRFLPSFETMPTVAEIQANLGGQILGNENLKIKTLASLEKADSGDISFLSNLEFKKRLENSNAGCVILPLALKDIGLTRSAAILTDNPYYYFAKLTQWWRQQFEKITASHIHPTAIIHPTAFIDPTASIGAYCHIGANSVLNSYVKLESHVSIGENSTIGEFSYISSYAQIKDFCFLGNNCIIHGGVVIGADGFGLALHNKNWEKIEQFGGVSIGNNVEIGANTCIDRGALDDTIIQNGVKLDNLIQIAHNVYIGENTAIAACVGIAGSARVGARCTIGGGAGILGHLELVDDVHISSFTLISRSIHIPGHYSGIFPFDQNSKWEKNAATLRQLYTLRERLRTLEKLQKI